MQILTATRQTTKTCLVGFILTHNTHFMQAFTSLSHPADKNFVGCYFCTQLHCLEKKKSKRGIKRPKSSQSMYRPEEFMHLHWVGYAKDSG